MIQAKQSQVRGLILITLILVSLLPGCSAKTTPPSPNSILGTVDGAVYSYHYWDEGLSILLWHDLSYGSESCSGSGSTEDPLFRQICSVAATDGRHFAWEIHTEDGLTADLWIDYRPFDLAQGNMFLITWQEDGLQIVQLTRDFSQLSPPDIATIEALAESDTAVADFIKNIPTQ